MILDFRLEIVDFRSSLIAIKDLKSKIDDKGEVSMSLSEEMSRLTQQFTEAYDDRIAAVGSIRTATAQELGEFRAAHEAMAVTTRQTLNQFYEALRQDVQALLHDCNAERQAMHADQRARLDSYISDLQQTVETFIHDATAERQAMHADQRARLDSYISHMRQTAQTFIHDCNAERQAMHADQRARLDAANAERHATRADQHARINQFLDQLKSDVETLRAETTAERNRNRADQTAAHQTWTQFSETMQQRRANHE
jgi:hypothetical protein